VIWILKRSKKKLDVKLMGKTCRGICILHKAKPVPNRIRYELGHKRCTFCGVFLLIEGPRCICCKAVLRTKSRSKKRA
jgi:hypothetical protein